MCGIAGAIHADPEFVRRAVGVMCDQMIARGPDDAGIALIDARDAAVALGNRRLAIIDPSPAGHQPMQDANRGTTIVFNGMIYNHRELRRNLAEWGEEFESRCDTEVVLKAYGRYGARCVDHLRGMFAFAVWDPSRQSLFMARDCFGIKPLYYAQTPNGLLFASQVKSLLSSGQIPERLSPAAVNSYLSFGAVSEPLTAIEGVLALPAGHTAIVRDGGVTLDRYWSPPAQSETTASRRDTSDELRARLEDSVHRHLVSDAPLGVFLSGGLDSSVLAALASRETARLTTVSVAFDEPDLSERSHMERVAAHIGSEHVCVTLRPDDALASLDGAFDAMDQPSFDGLNTYFVSREAARAGLKVALSGLGADELFDGYGHTSRISALERAALMPGPFARFAGGVVGRTKKRGNLEKAQAWLAGGSDRGSAYELLRRVFLAEETGRLAPGSAAATSGSSCDVQSTGDLYGRVTALDLGHYTNNVLLRDTDAMSMAHSLEVRVPYLDRELAEWVMSLPARLRRGGGKALLVEATADLLPPEILQRRKQGFALPLARWMRDELRVEIDGALRNPPDELADLVDRDACLAVWEQFLRDGRRWTRPWALFALHRWTRSIGARERVAA